MSNVSAYHLTLSNQSLKTKLISLFRGGGRNFRKQYSSFLLFRIFFFLYFSSVIQFLSFFVLLFYIALLLLFSFFCRFFFNLPFCFFLLSLSFIPQFFLSFFPFFIPLHLDSLLYICHFTFLSFSVFGLYFFFLSFFPSFQFYLSPSSSS